MRGDGLIALQCKNGGWKVEGGMSGEKGKGGEVFSTYSDSISVYYYFYGFHGYKFVLFMNSVVPFIMCTFKLSQIYCYIISHCYMICYCNVHCVDYLFFMLTLKVFFFVKSLSAM